MHIKLCEELQIPESGTHYECMPHGWERQDGGQMWIHFIWRPHKHTPMAAALPHPGAKQVCSVVGCTVALLLAGSGGQNLQHYPGSRMEALDSITMNLNVRGLEPSFSQDATFMIYRSL